MHYFSLYSQDKVGIVRNSIKERLRINYARHLCLYLKSGWSWVSSTWSQDQVAQWPQKHKPSLLTRSTLYYHYFMLFLCVTACPATAIVIYICYLKVNSAFYRNHKNVKEAVGHKPLELWGVFKLGKYLPLLTLKLLL